MRNSMQPTVEYSVEIEVNDDYDYYELVISLGITNDGIGSYEYWGFKGYDQGVDYVEEWDIKKVSLDGKQIEWLSIPQAIRDQIEKQVDAWCDDGSALEALGEKERDEYDAAMEARAEAARER